MPASFNGEVRLRGAVFTLILLGTAWVFILLVPSCTHVSDECPPAGSAPGCPGESDFKLEPLFLGPVPGSLPPPPTPVSLPIPVTERDAQIFGPTPGPDFAPTPAPMVVNPILATPKPNQVEAPTPRPLLPTLLPEATPVVPPTPVGAVFYTPTPTIIAPVPTPTLTPTPIPQSVVRVSLEIDSRELQVGQTFLVAVRVWAGHFNPVDAAQVYLDFDGRQLEVVELTPGSHLEYELQSKWDNQVGRLGYAAGTVGDPVTVPFTLCTVAFRIREPANSDEIAIGFAPLAPPRQTKAVFRGANVTGELVPVRVKAR